MDDQRRMVWRSLNSAPRRSPRTDALGVERFFLRQLLSALHSPPLRFRLWDGTEVAGRGDPVATVSIHDRATLWKLALDPELQFGEAYTNGRLEVDGDLVALLEMAYRGARGGGLHRSLRRVLHRNPRANSRARSRHNIHHHYDLGNDFYRLWLDEELLYTCAYYTTPEQSLEEAQRAKMEHVCRKLQLQPGERVVEAGSGWGALALYMARHYGVTVKSYNISHRQVEFARRRSHEAGLEGQVEFIEDDYRGIAGEFDVFVSVGMLEHVGPSNYRELGGVIHRALGPDGRILIHTIGRSRPNRLNAWIQRRIFPGAQPPTLEQMMEIFRPWDFVVLDVENLRLHYALTLRHWLERYEASIEQVRERFGERFVRLWRLYLSGSLAAFQAGGLELFQVVANRVGSNRVAMTREHLYTPSEGTPCRAAMS